MTLAQEREKKEAKVGETPDVQTVSWLTDQTGQRGSRERERERERKKKERKKIRRKKAKARTGTGEKWSSNTDRGEATGGWERGSTEGFKEKEGFISW